MMMAFTGTRYGMTMAQRESFRRLLQRLRPGTFRHGVCQGADEEASLIVEVFDPRPTIIGHPGPEGDPYRARGPAHDWLEAPAGHFARNRAMVDASDCLVAAPYTSVRQKRGGTWYTCDYAVKKKKPVYVLLPEGKTVLVPPGWTYEAACEYVEKHKEQPHE